MNFSQNRFWLGLNRWKICWGYEEIEEKNFGEENWRNWFWC